MAGIATIYFFPDWESSD